MLSIRDFQKPHVILVVVVAAIINVVVLLAGARFAAVFYELPLQAKLALHGSAGGNDASRSPAIVNEYFPVCIFLSIGDDTSDINDAALPFPFLYRLFDAAKVEMLKIGPGRNSYGGVGSSKTNFFQFFSARSSSNSSSGSNLPVKVLVGVDYPSVACNMSNDSLRMDFMDTFPNITVELTCGSPAAVKEKLLTDQGANSTSKLKVRCGTAIAGQSTRHVSQINAAWMKFLRWEHFRVIDLDKRDPSRDPPALSRDQWRPTFVTAFSSNHFAVAMLLLRSIGKAGQEIASTGKFNMSIVVYKLEEFNSTLNGLLDCLVRELDEKYFVPAEVRQFNFSQYPTWMRINQTLGYFGGTGEYAWKAVMIHEVLVERGFVIWGDGGTRFDTEGLLQSLNNTREHGFASANSMGNVPYLLHPGALKYFRYQVKTDPYVKNCDASRIGITLDSYATVGRPWYDCGLTRQCIAPAGSDRANHRQDQSALTLISDLAGKPCQGVPDSVSIHMDHKPNNFSSTLPTSCYQDPLQIDSAPP